ncbi:MAG TPA: zinc-binding dehydrogenase [Jatrophihabitantaceae bacterium]|nr:zinc-binding dehydrogenase [Jatrophihabitantaceae bacterium]
MPCVTSKFFNVVHERMSLHGVGRGVQPVPRCRRSQHSAARVGGANAAPGAIEEIARLVATGRLRVPIAATFPVEQIRAAVELQAGRHVHGKIVIDL